jgi:hypothetical protein
MITEGKIRPFTQDEIRHAFAFLPGVKPQKRGGGAYWLVRGPSTGAKGKAYISIEPNGAVSFAPPLAEQMGAELRPIPEVMVTEHPLGAALGPDYGIFKHGLRPEEIARRFAKARDFADAVVDGFAKAGLKW